MTTARRLLKAIDRLPYGARQRLLARTARELAATGELDALLCDLDGRGEFERRVALHLAYVARDGAYVEQCLSAGQTSVVRQAIGAAIRLDLPAEVFLARLPHLPTALRQTFYSAIRRHGRGALAERLLPVVRETFGDHEAAGLLPVCSSAVVIEALPDLEHAIANWGALGRSHPTVLLDFVTAELSAVTPVWWPDVWRRFGDAAAGAAVAEPDRVLDLLERLLPHAPLPWQIDRVIGGLARHAPERVARMLVDPRRTGHLPQRQSLWRALAVIGDDELIAVARLLDGSRLARFLHAIAPSRRAAVFTGALDDRPDAPLDAVDELPSAARPAVARRLLALRQVADDPARRLAVTARLAWADARDTLLAATRRATADERAEAYPLYLAAAAATRDPEVVGGVITGLTRLANEQDPVRSVAIAALAAIPGWLFRPDEADALVKLMVDATEARDCSWQTQQAVRALADTVIREGAMSLRPQLVEAGLTGLAHMSRNAPWISLNGLDRLPRGAEHQVFEALRPRITADARLGRFEVLLAVAAGLRRRAWDMGPLQELLDEARSAKDDGVVRRAVELWLAPSAQRDERVERVFADDPSTITLHPVRQAIALRRTDLLDRVIGRSPHGRFLKRGVRYVPPFEGCFDRWLPRQVTAFAAELTDVATSPRASAFERRAAVSSLGRVPGSVNLVRGFVADRETIVAEAALAALAWTDEPGDVLPDLLAHVGTDRARVAVYALGRCARFTMPERLGALLAPVLEGQKVTARKEAVRLIAKHRTPGAVVALTGAWENGHRDVRRALVSATRWFLDDEAAWDLLGRAVADEHAVAGAVLDLGPDVVARRHRARYAELVGAIAGSADPDTARLGLAASPSWIRWSDSGAEPLVDRVTDLADTATWRYALSALVRLSATTADVTPLRAVVTALLAADGEFDAVEDRDLPARQRIAALVGELSGTRNSEHSRAAARTLIPSLAAAGYGSWAVNLAVVAVAWEEEGADLDGLREVARLAVRPTLARQAAGELTAVLPDVMRRSSPARLLDVANALAGSGAAALALGIAIPAGRDAGWPEGWRELLRGLRRHDDPDVREAASAVFTSQE
ncbi:hypothetical protein F4560_002068 [Saccharothrix ecbatanensis]|uniref:HEAT repeat protein n=1 Tax=Saccharothrix ecbatanensis TaxID=1105145 RepID=A0A7W9LZU7_9PSEU|nr:hypothetical protein [Saccharothrix ecbatanensis]MBB5802300.1 hypothetical protein [Saccharothrix ecbatanensis]